MARSAQELTALDQSLVTGVVSVLHGVSAHWVRNPLGPGGEVLLTAGATAEDCDAEDTGAVPKPWIRALLDTVAGNTLAAPLPEGVRIIGANGYGYAYRYSNTAHMPVDLEGLDPTVVQGVDGDRAPDDLPF